MAIYVLVRNAEPCKITYRSWGSKGLRLGKVFLYYQNITNIASLHKIRLTFFSLRYKIQAWYYVLNYWMLLPLCIWYKSVDFCQCSMKRPCRQNSISSILDISIDEIRKVKARYCNIEKILSSTYRLIELFILHEIKYI